MNSLKKELSVLASKPILTSSNWFRQSNFDKAQIPADLYCPTCAQMKTFVGKSYSNEEAIYYFEQSLNQRMTQRHWYNEDLKEFIKNLFNEMRFSYDNIAITKLTCPVCGHKIYQTFAIEPQPQSIEKATQPGGESLYRVVKIGEYPNQEQSRLILLNKYFVRFSAEHALLVKAHKACQIGLGAGAMVYLRRAYESLLFAILDANGVEHPRTFKDTLKTADEIAQIVPEVLKDKAYGLFGEISDVVHGGTDDNVGLEKYEDLRDVFLLILDHILEKERVTAIANKIRLDNNPRGSQPLPKSEMGNG
jgi:hypothetical protein